VIRGKIGSATEKRKINIIMIDYKYNELLRKILEEGKEKTDRTGTGTISIFNAQIEHNMSDGFPLLTCKKVFVRGIIHELLWFLNGDTNIQYLVKNGVNIWTADAYREYKNFANKADEPDYDIHIDDPNQNRTRIMTMDEFKENIINSDIFAHTWGNLGPIYGKQWVNWGGYNIVSGEEVDGLNKGVNQIQQAIDTLKTNPDSRRIIVTAWNPSEIDKMSLPPCHWAFELYTEKLTNDEFCEYHSHELWQDIAAYCSKDKTFEKYANEGGFATRKLSLKWHQRSVDTFLGLPFNIASYGLLLEMIAQQCNMVPDKLVGDLTNVHIYKNHIEQCSEQLERQPMELCKLDLTKADDIFSYEYDNIKFADYHSHPPIKGDISV